MDSRGKIFNIGLPKTGTTSLHAALEALGYRSIHNPLHWRRPVYEGNYRVCDGYDAVTNFAEHTYPQFDAAYPGSKFILTLRGDVEAWLDSWRRQIGEGRGNERLDRIINRRTFWKPGAWWWMLRTINRMDGREPVSNLHTRIELFAAYRFVPERCRYVYEQHRDAAMRYFADRPDDLLVMDITAGDGWEKLCPFLGVDVPADTPFPRRLPQKSWNDR